MLIFHVVAGFCLLMSQLHMESRFCPQPTTTQGNSTGTGTPGDGAAATANIKPLTNGNVRPSKGNVRVESRIMDSYKVDDNHGPSTSKPATRPATTELVVTPEKRPNVISTTTDDPYYDPSILFTADTCKIHEDCPDRQLCTHNKCQCYHGHQNDSSGQCTKRCLNDRYCSRTEKCSTGLCTCRNDRVWSNKVMGCVKECSPSNNICEPDAESCEPVKSHFGCTCSTGYIWDSSHQVCAQSCDNGHNCQNEGETCHKTSKKCVCDKNYFWHYVREKCEILTRRATTELVVTPEKRPNVISTTTNQPYSNSSLPIPEYSCKTDDCLERQMCDDNSICACAEKHQNISGKCILPCTSGKSCDLPHHKCSGVGISEACTCQTNYEWSNDRDACIARCERDDDCDTLRETCDIIGNGPWLCDCKSEYSWDYDSSSCRKKCNPEDEHSCEDQPNEYCPESEHRCSCEIPYKWNSFRSSCEIEENSRKHFTSIITRPASTEVAVTPEKRPDVISTTTNQPYSNSSPPIPVTRPASTEVAVTPEKRPDVISTTTNQPYSNSSPPIPEDSCKINDECPERHICDDEDICVCAAEHQNISGQCILPCTSDKSCDLPHHECSKVGNSEACTCQTNYVWSNDHDACIKRCERHDDCDTRREICAPIGNDPRLCNCKPGYDWDYDSSSCRKKCDPEDEHSCEDQPNEYCKGSDISSSSSTDYLCVCETSYKWDSSRSSCERQKW